MAASSDDCALPFTSAELWDEVASGYARNIMPFFASFAEEAARIVAPKANEHVFDVACGPGTLALRLAPRVRRVSAVDNAPAMVRELRAIAGRVGVTNVDGHVMDAQNLAFEDGVFDAAFCLFAVMHFQDRARALGEMRRVLRRQGRALVATWATLVRRPFVKIGFEAMREAFPEVEFLSDGVWEEPDECLSELSAAGFHQVTSTRAVATIRIHSPQHYLSIVERSGVGLATLRRLFAEGWPVARGELLQSLRRRIPEDGMDLTAEALMSACIRQD